MQGQFNTNHLRVLVVTESLLKPKTTTNKKKNHAAETKIYENIT